MTRVEKGEESPMSPDPKTLRLQELAQLSQRAFPFIAYLGGQRLEVLGPTRAFWPYNDPRECPGATGGPPKPADYLQLMARSEDGEKVIALASQLCDRSGRPLLTPGPPRPWKSFLDRLPNPEPGRTQKIAEVDAEIARIQSARGRAAAEYKMDSWSRLGNDLQKAHRRREWLEQGGPEQWGTGKRKRAARRRKRADRAIEGLEEILAPPRVSMGSRTRRGLEGQLEDARTELRRLDEEGDLGSDASDYWPPEGRRTGDNQSSDQVPQERVQAANRTPAEEHKAKKLARRADKLTNRVLELRERLIQLQSAPSAVWREIREEIKRTQEELQRVQGRSEYLGSDAAETAVPEPGAKPEFAEIARTQQWRHAFTRYVSYWFEKLIESGWIDRFEEASKIKIGNCFACGAFGCAFEIVAPEQLRHYICKITSDQSEGPNQAFIKQFQEGTATHGHSADDREHMKRGFTRVHTVYQSPKTIPMLTDPGIGRRGGNYPVFAIIREDIQPVHERGKGCLPAPTGGVSMDPYDYNWLVAYLSDYREQARVIQELYSRLHRHERMGSLTRTSVEDTKARITGMLGHAGESLEHIRKLAPSIAGGLATWTTLSGEVPLADVHIGNIGYRKWPEFGKIGELVIFDPGYTQTPRADTEEVRSTMPFVSNNPSRGVRL